MRPPEGMTRTTWDRVMELPLTQRYAVLERSCLLFYGGAVTTWTEADERAMAEEAGRSTQQSLGVG